MCKCLAMITDGPAIELHSLRKTARRRRVYGLLGHNYESAGRHTDPPHGRVCGGIRENNEKGAMAPTSDSAVEARPPPVLRGPS